MKINEWLVILTLFILMFLIKMHYAGETISPSSTIGWMEALIK